MNFIQFIIPYYICMLLSKTKYSCMYNLQDINFDTFDMQMRAI